MNQFEFIIGLIFQYVFRQQYYFLSFQVSFADDHLKLPPPPVDLDSAISSSTTIAAVLEDEATEAANDLAMAEQVISYWRKAEIHAKLFLLMKSILQQLWLKKRNLDLQVRRSFEEAELEAMTAAEAQKRTTKET